MCPEYGRRAYGIPRRRRGIRRGIIHRNTERIWLDHHGIAAAALRVSPRTVRDYINSGELKAKSEGKGVTKRWLVSIDAVQALRDKRSSAGGMLRARRDAAVGDLIAAANAVDIGDLVAALRELEHRLGRAEARAELTERTESSLREDLEREQEERRQAREEAERLRLELEAERSKGFWRRLLGG